MVENIGFSRTATVALMLVLRLVCDVVYCG